MINKRLLSLCDKSHIYRVVICNWLAMMLNVGMIFRLGYQVQSLYNRNFIMQEIAITIAIFVAVIIFRAFIKQISVKEAHLAGSGMKNILRTMLHNKLLKLGTSYTKNLSTAEVMQISTEGVDQLETYFGSYLPQMFYCMIAPITLFAIIAPINLLTAIVLFICVPLIPISIIIIQKIAKRILSKYWGLYAALGDNFLENIQGMTTLKIYQADEVYHEEMNKSAENFRIITMKVLSMQLNSIIVMDTIAYGGAALGGILAVYYLNNATISLMSAAIIILLASEFFLPMRALGSFFHIAMNGIAAADKMFNILDMQEPKSGEMTLKSENLTMNICNLKFSYTSEKEILKGINFTVKNGLTALVGTSGCGKSTIASLLSLKERDYIGSIKISDIELRDISAKSLHENITHISDQGYIFSGTVEENLLLAKENATELEMIAVLKKVHLWEFLQAENGLKTALSERGSNFSGGQRQRLSLARALLRNSPIYILDEVTSNIDVESENAIIDVIHQMAKTKIVILISHRLANVVNANQILLLNQGKISEIGTHKTLLEKNGNYAKLFLEQQALEQYGKEGLTCENEVLSQSFAV